MLYWHDASSVFGGTSFVPVLGSTQSYSTNKKTHNSFFEVNCWLTLGIIICHLILPLCFWLSLFLYSFPSILVCCLTMDIIIRHSFLPLSFWLSLLLYSFPCTLPCCLAEIIIRKPISAFTFLIISTALFISIHLTMLSDFDHHPSPISALIFLIISIHFHPPYHAVWLWRLSFVNPRGW